MVLFRGFSQIHDVVRKQKTHPIPPNCQSSVEELCGAVDYACVFYFKEVLCLQRSAATTLLLRHHGIPAEMVIGAQVLPFRSHAWVELDGVVVNDKPYMLDIYRVLERC
jgi:Transglutaminase-like superfamily